MDFRYTVRIDQLNGKAKGELLTKLVASGALTYSGYRIIDKVMLEHKPFPKWALDNVLLSSDLLPKILSSAHLPDAPRVCKTWHSLWLKLGCAVQAVGSKPAGRTWQDEYVDMWTERGRLESAREWPRSQFEAGGVNSIEAWLRNLAAHVQWKVDHGWPRADAEAYTLIASCVGAPLAAAVRERSDRYAASTHAVCDALAQRARQVTEAAPPVYWNLTGKFGLATDDPAFAALAQPGASAGLGLVTNGVAKGDKPNLNNFPTQFICLKGRYPVTYAEGYHTRVQTGTEVTYELQKGDVVCFRSAPADADGYHSLIQTKEDRYELPPLATVTLERVQPPGEWEVCGQRVRQRLLTMSVSF